MAKRELDSIHTIFIHCSATPEGRDVKVEEIDKWHRERGFNGIGYHYYVDVWGNVHTGRSIDRVGAHVKGENVNSIGICYAGGIDQDGGAKDTLTPKQFDSIRTLVLSLGEVLQKPLNLRGHNEVSNKACPCFTVKEKFNKEQLLLHMLYSSEDAT